MLAAVHQSHAELSARRDELRALVDLSQALLGTLDVTLTLKSALQQAMSATSSPAGAILLSDSNGEAITIRTVLGLPDTLVGRSFPVDAHTAPGYALATRQPVTSPDLER